MARRKSGRNSRRRNWIVNKKEQSKSFDLLVVSSPSYGIPLRTESRPLPSTASSSSVIFSEYQFDFSLFVVLRLRPRALAFASPSSQQIRRLCFRFIHSYRPPILLSPSSPRRHARFAPSFFSFSVGYRSRLDWKRGPSSWLCFEGCLYRSDPRRWTAAD